MYFFRAEEGDTFRLGCWGFPFGDIFAGDVDGGGGVDRDGDIQGELFIFDRPEQK